MHLGIPRLVRRTALAALLALLCAPSGAQAATALSHTFEKAIWGPVTTDAGTSAFPIYHRLGVDTFQIQLTWAATARRRPADATDSRDPAYHWPAEIREAVRMGRRYGIRIAIMVKGTPAWANGGGDVTVPPTSDSDIADFFTAATKHYPGVRRWMVWGEPGRLANWSPLPQHQPDAPRRYATLLEASYQAIKRASLRNVVIGGMTFTAGDVFPAEWVQWMRLPSGRPPHLDWWGHNPFSFRPPVLADHPYFKGGRDISDLDTLHTEIAAAYSGAHMRVPRLWISEFTVSSDHANRAFAFFVTRAEQAAWLTAGFAIARRVDAAGIGWFGLFDEAATLENPTTFGLLDAAGKPKPAFDAYRSVRSAPPASY